LVRKETGDKTNSFEILMILGLVEISITMAAPMASPQEIVERDAAEALANDYWERIVMRALDVRQESPDSLTSSSSPLRVPSHHDSHDFHHQHTPSPSSLVTALKLNSIVFTGVKSPPLLLGAWAQSRSR
jgi:hypothetical protein